MAKKKTVKSAAGAKRAVKAHSTSKTKAGTAKSSAAKKKRAAAQPATLGRPKVTGDEELWQLFHNDYQARQVFEFLRVTTVRELEQFTPQEIFRRLTQPMRQTVDGIRRVLAEKNRHLAEDLEFALEHQASRGDGGGMS